MTMRTALGQTLDLLSCPPEKKPILSKFTMHHYNAIVKYKTAYYSFYLPVALSMYMVSIRLFCKHPAKIQKGQYPLMDTYC